MSHPGFEFSRALSKLASLLWVLRHPKFCENSVKNLRDSYSENCKYLGLSSLRGILNAAKYL